MIMKYNCIYLLLVGLSQNVFNGACEQNIPRPAYAYQVMAPFT